MLSALRIEHFAIIDSLEVDFDAGLTVLTGETGAGKSILVDALHLALGGRAQGDVVRTGFDEASVEAVFAASPTLRERLRSLGLPDGPELLIRRVVHRAGRSRVWVNGALCTVSVLEQLVRQLCDISGQHEHVNLLNPDGHLDLLDGFAGLAESRAAYNEAYRELADAEQQRKTLMGDETERGRRLDYLAYQLREIDQIAPEPDEDRALRAEREVLASAAKLQAAAEEAEAQLYSGEGAAAERLARAVGALGDLLALDPNLARIHGALASARAEIEEAARELQIYARRSQEDPARLEAVEDRLASLQALCRKHGGDLGAVLRRREEMRGEVEALTNRESRLVELDGRLDLARSEATKRAASLSMRRREAAGRLATRLMGELARLGMARTRFEARVAPTELGPRGADQVEFFLSANPGEAPRPLARIASGGELSRLLLAFKGLGATSDPVEVYVFDEIDSGVGGATAQVVGRMLHDVSHSRQVLCITHLPQIAAHADQHLSVRKALSEGRTVVEVMALGTVDSRARELARMLGGEETTPIAVRHAKDLLRRSAAPGNGAQDSPAGTLN
jgi:DNA repair protein RecN (Recombination protein N)